MVKKLKIICAMLFLLCIGSVLAAIPDQITVPLYVKTSAGSEVSGTYNMSFRLYDVSTGGTALFTQTENVVLDDGVGETILYDTGLRYNVSYWLEIFLDGTVLTPRVNLTKTPYAHTSNVSESAYGDCPPGEFIQNITSAGLQCSATAGSGDITSVLSTNDRFIYNGSAIGAVVLRFNDTLIGLEYVNVTGDTMTGGLLSTSFNASGSSNASMFCLDDVCIDTWPEINGSAVDTTIGNCSVDGSCSELVYGGNTTWITSNQINFSDTFVTSANVSGWGIYYYAASNITDLGLYYYAESNLTSLLDDNYLGIGSDWVNVTGDTITGDLIIEGNLTIIGSYLNATVINQFLNGSFYPALTNLFTIGNGTNKWSHIYGTNINGTNMCIGSLCISTWDEINKTDSFVTEQNITGWGFFDDEDNLTGLLDNNYLGVGSDWVNVSGDTMTGGIVGTSFNASGSSNASVFCLDDVCIDTYDEINGSADGDTFVTSANVSGWGFDQFDQAVNISSNVIFNNLTITNLLALDAVKIASWDEVNKSGSGIINGSNAYLLDVNASGKSNASMFCLDAICVDTWPEINKSTVDTTIGNCSVDGSCDEIVYGTNVTWITSNQINFTDTNTTDQYLNVSSNVIFNNLTITNLLALDAVKIASWAEVNKSGGGIQNGSNAQLLFLNVSKNLTISENLTVYGNLTASSIGLGAVSIGGWAEVNKTFTDTTIGNCSGDGSCPLVVYSSNVTWITSNQINFTDTDTHVRANTSYLYNNSVIISFNQTRLNETIDARDQDTFVSSSNVSGWGIYYYTEANLTGLLDNNYLGVGSDWVNVTGDTMSGGLLSTSFNASGSSNASMFCLDDVCIDTWPEVNGSAGDGVGIENGSNAYLLDVNASGQLNTSNFCLDAVCIDTYDEINKSTVDTTIGNCSVDGSCDEIVYGTNVTWITSNQINFTDTNTTDQYLNVTSNVIFNNLTITNLLALDAVKIASWAEVNKSGGAGIENGSNAVLAEVNITGNLNVSKNLTVSENVTIYKNLFVDGITNIADLTTGENITAGDSVSIDNRLLVDGDSHLMADVYVSYGGLNVSLEINSSRMCVDAVCIDTWSEINKTGAADGVGIINGSNAYLLDVNASNQLNTSNFCMDALCIDTFDEVNGSTFSTIDLSGTSITTWAEVNKTFSDTTIGNCSVDGSCPELVYSSNVTWITSNQINFSDTYVTSANVSGWGIYYYTEANLTGLLDNNYLGIGSDWVNITSDNMTGSLAVSKNLTVSENLSVYGKINFSGVGIASWAEINKSGVFGMTSANVSGWGFDQFDQALNISSNVIFNNLTITNLLALDAVIIASWAEVNITDTFVTSTNVSAWGIYYFDVYNLTSQLNTTYVTRKGGNMTGNLNMSNDYNITDVKCIIFDNGAKFGSCG